MRLFVALTPDEVCLDALERLQEEIPLGRLVSRENLHLTLAFAGEVSNREAEALDDALCDISSDPFQVELSRVETFGGSDPKIIWISAAPVPGLVSLHRKARTALHLSGIMPDRQRFRPHITLARLPRGLGSGDLARLAGFLSVWGAVRVAAFGSTSFSLFRSFLGPDGSRYEELARYDFAGGAGVEGGEIA